MKKKKLLISIILFSLILNIVFAVTGQVTSFFEKTNPFEITTNTISNETIYLSLPSSGYLNNITFYVNSTQYAVNDPTVAVLISQYNNWTQIRTFWLIQNNISYGEGDTAEHNITYRNITTDGNFSYEAYINFSTLASRGGIAICTDYHNDTDYCGWDTGYAIGTNGYHLEMLPISNYVILKEYYYGTENILFQKVMTPGDTQNGTWKLNIFWNGSSCINVTRNGVQFYSTVCGVQNYSGFRTIGLTADNGLTYVDNIIVSNQTGTYFSDNFTTIGQASYDVLNKFYIDNYNFFNLTSDSINEVSINITKINNILYNNCSCDSCYTNNHNCNLAIKIDANNTNTIKINLTNLTYSFGIDNCSNSYNIPSNASAFNISTYDQKTNILINSNAYFLYNYYIGNNITYSQYSNTIYNKNTYEFCKYPAWSNIYGDMTHTFNSSGYEPINFYRFNILYSGIFKAYQLPTESTSNYITYTIVDNSLKAIEGAFMYINRTIDGVSELVFNGQSDVAGQVIVYQDQLYKYNYLVTAEGYPDKTFDLQPVLTSYSVKISEGGETIISTTPYSNIKYKVLPETTMFNISDDFQNITFYLEGIDLEYFGINITSNEDYICIPSDCLQTSTSSTGGIVSTAIKINHTGRFYVNLFYKKFNEEEVTINSYPYNGVLWEDARNSIVNILKDIRDNTSPNVRTVLAALIQCIVIIVASYIGIVGLGLLYVDLIVTIILSIPDKTYMVGNIPIQSFGIGLIPPLTGLIINIFLVLMIIYYSRLE